MQSVSDVTCGQMWINCENQLNFFFLAPPMCSSAVSKETQTYIKWAPRVKTCLMHLRTTRHRPACAVWSVQLWFKSLLKSIISSLAINKIADNRLSPDFLIWWQPLVTSKMSGDNRLSPARSLLTTSCIFSNTNGYPIQQYQAFFINCFSIHMYV